MCYTNCRKNEEAEKKMKLYLVRHGQTDWNKERRIQGRADIELNEFGRHLAVETGKGLKDVPFAACFSSPLKRAVETAQLILGEKDLPVLTDERIAEMDFAEYEGKCCMKENWELPESFRNFFEAPDRYEPAEGGESFADMKKRTRAFLDDLCAREEFRNENILVVTHGAALAGMLNNIKGKPLSQYWGTGVHKNCAVTEVLLDGKQAEILAENKAYYEDEVKPW